MAVNLHTSIQTKNATTQYSKAIQAFFTCCFYTLFFAIFVFVYYSKMMKIKDKKLKIGD